MSERFLFFFLNISGNVGREKLVVSLQLGFDHNTHSLPSMADIYSKGTRVWFPDKEQGWISAEVTAYGKGSKDGVKITFVDERGKVSSMLAFISYGS